MSAVNGLTDLMEVERPGIEEYTELLVRRDQLQKEAASYMTCYTAEFGELITKNFELKIACIKKKKTINYCRRRMNRGLAIDAARMNEEIEQEMQLYYVQLQEMINDTETARRAKDVGEFRFNRAKKIYRRLAKLLHPDINKETMENETLKDLWTRIVIAYRSSNIDELDDLEVLVHKAMESIGEEAFVQEIDDIEEKIERVERQINDILTTEPYTYREILCDAGKKEAYKDQLQKEYEDYEQYLESLKETFEEMLCQGGANLVWKMN